MARKFSVPAAPAVYTTRYNDFKGVDYRAEDTTCERTRFPDAQNIIIEGTGFPEKRIGWRKLINIDEPVEGICTGYVNNRKETILQIGRELYRYKEDKTAEKPYVLEQIYCYPSDIDKKFTITFAGAETVTYDYFEFVELLSPIYWSRGILVNGIREAVDGKFYRVDRATMTIRKQKLVLKTEPTYSITTNSVSTEMYFQDEKKYLYGAYFLNFNKVKATGMSRSTVYYYETTASGDDIVVTLYKRIEENGNQNFYKIEFQDEETTKQKEFLSGESKMVSYDGKIYILNSAGYFVYDGKGVYECKGTKAYAPIVTTQRNYVFCKYEGNANWEYTKSVRYEDVGIQNEKINLLSNVRCDEFAVGPSAMGGTQISTRSGSAINYLTLSSNDASKLLKLEMLTGPDEWTDITDYFFNTIAPDMMKYTGGGYYLYEGVTNLSTKIYIDEFEGNKCAIVNEIFYYEAQSGGMLYNSVRIPSLYVADGITNNVRVTYTVSDESFEEKYSKIRKCKTITKYGVTEEDRIFLTGNDEYKNYVWYSEFQNPLYIPDLNYITVGYDNTAVVGFLKFQDYLVALKEKTADDTNIFLVKGEVAEDGTVFKVRSGIQGVGAISNKGFAYADDEPLFLASNGVFALQTISISQERNVANRSGFINHKFETEEKKENAAMCRWKNYIIIALNNHAYVLNINQKTYTDDIGAGYYKTYYYEASFWDNIPATDFFLINDELYFYHNSVSGKGSFIAKFNSDIKDVSKYNDVSISNEYTNQVLGVQTDENDDDDDETLHKDNKPVPIDAWFTTKADDDGSFMVLKTMVKRGCGIMIKPYTRSSAEIYVITDKEEKKEPVKTAKAGMLDFSDLDFSLISFNTRDVATIIPLNTKVKKYSTLQFMVRNNEPSQGMGVLGIEKRYKTGNYKKY